MKQRFSLKSNTGIIKLSHMSVKDYLISRHQVAATGFSINEKLSHSLIAKTCLAYLLQFESLDMLDLYPVYKYPLAEYAAEYWVRHVQYGVEEGTDVQQDKLIMTLFQPWHTAPFISWVRMHNIDCPWGNRYFLNDRSDIASTLYYASCAGLYLQLRAW
jgi:hypothetical protein